MIHPVGFVLHLIRVGEISHHATVGYRDETATVICRIFATLLNKIFSSDGLIVKKRPVRLYCYGKLKDAE